MSVIFVIWTVIGFALWFATELAMGTAMGTFEECPKWKVILFSILCGPIAMFFGLTWLLSLLAQKWLKGK